MGTVIAVTSGKGGTGKTSITGGVAASLALMGHTVLCIDMDIGLRNLDITLGLSDRALMDFSDVALGRCPLARGAVDHPDVKGLSLLTAPMSLSPSLTIDKVRAMLDTARGQYDYILIDSPAGLGAGFRLAICGADRALVIATNDASSLRDAQRTVCRAGEYPPGPPDHESYPAQAPPEAAGHYRRCHEHRRPASDWGGAGGQSGHAGRQPGPALDRPGRRGAALACWNIALRLDGNQVPIMRIR